MRHTSTSSSKSLRAQAALKQYTGCWKPASVRWSIIHIRERNTLSAMQVSWSVSVMFDRSVFGFHCWRPDMHGGVESKQGATEAERSSQEDAAFSYFKTRSKRRNPAARVNFLANRKQGLASPAALHHSVRASVSYRMLRRPCMLTCPMVTPHKLLNVISQSPSQLLLSVSTMLEDNQGLCNGEEEEIFWCGSGLRTWIFFTASRVASAKA